MYWPKRHSMCHSNSNIFFCILFLINRWEIWFLCIQFHFNTHIDLCNCHCKQDTEQFHCPRKLICAIALKSHPPPIPDHWFVLHHYIFILLKMSYKWKYTVCNVLRSSSFTQHNTFQIDSNCCMLFPFYHWVIFHWMNVPQFVYTFIPQRIFVIIQMLVIMNRTL